MNVKIIVHAKKILFGILAHAFVRIVSKKHLKNISDASVTKCYEIIIVMDNVSTNKTNTIATNVPSTPSINHHSKKTKLFYFAYSFFSDHITINNNYCLLWLCKTKRYNIKWEIMN